jgi:restriction system protein
LTESPRSDFLGFWAAVEQDPAPKVVEGSVGVCLSHALLKLSHLDADDTGMARRRSTTASDDTAKLVLLALLGLTIAVVRFAQQHPVLSSLIGACLLVVLGFAARYLIIRRRMAAARQAEIDRHLATADASSPREFEHLIARLLARDGFREVRVVGGAGDLGADVTAISPTGRLLVVQCKRYTNRAVSSPDVQRFLGTCFHEHHADDAWIVTTSWFSRPGRDLAQRHGVRTIDRRDLGRWMERPNEATSGPTQLA